MPSAGCQASCERSEAMLGRVRRIGIGYLPGNPSSGSEIAPEIQASLKSPEQCSAPGCAQCALRSVHTLNKVRPHSPKVILDSTLTDKALPIFRVPVEVLSVANHATSQMRHGQCLLLVVALVALRNSLDIASHGLVNPVDTWVHH